MLQSLFLKADCEIISPQHYFERTQALTRDGRRKRTDYLESLPVEFLVTIMKNMATVTTLMAFLKAFPVPSKISNIGTKNHLRRSRQRYVSRD